MGACDAPLRISVAGGSAFALAGGWIDVFGVSDLWFGPANSVLSEYSERFRGGFGGDRPDVRLDRRSQGSVVDPTLVAFGIQHPKLLAAVLTQSLTESALRSEA